MANWLSRPGDLAKATWNVLSSVWPFLLSQSDTASEAYARHQSRLAGVDVGKELLLQEAKLLGDLRRRLLERQLDAEPIERLRIRHDLEEIDASIRHLNIGTKALNYLPSPNQNPAADAAQPEANANPSKGVSPHWTDKFNELARAHNEPWREELLARALAAESASPESVSPRALWLLGTLEEAVFISFAMLLDLSSSIAGGLMIPQHNDFAEEPIPGCPLGKDVAIGNLVYRVGEVGLFADTVVTKRTVRKGFAVLAAYGFSRVFVTCNADLVIGGVIPTGLGASLASFYQPKFNPLGKKIFDAWIASLDTTKFVITKIS